jgi:hypothetical protein
MRVGVELQARLGDEVVGQGSERVPGVHLVPAVREEALIFRVCLEEEPEQDLQRDPVGRVEIVTTAQSLELPGDGHRQ